MSMYLLTPEEAAQEAFVNGDNSAYTRLIAEKNAEKREREDKDIANSSEKIK